MTIHCLKTWPKPFSLMLSGAKAFELRVNDRGFRSGDLLCLQEFDQFAQTYTGRELQRRITCIIDAAGPVKLPDGLVGLLRQIAEHLGVPMNFGEVEEHRLLQAVEDLVALKGGV